MNSASTFARRALGQFRRGPAAITLACSLGLVAGLLVAGARHGRPPPANPAGRSATITARGDDPQTVGPDGREASEAGIALMPFLAPLLFPLSQAFQRH